MKEPKNAKKFFWKFQHKNAPYIFLLPFLILLVSFYVLPILYSILLGFTEWSFSGFEFTGLNNYINLPDNQIFFQALWNSTFYVLATLLVVLPIALASAVLLHNKLLKKFGLITQRIIYLPSITPLIAIGIIFSLMFEENSGAINAFLNIINLPSVSWLSSVEIAKWSIVIVILWRWTGYNAVYYLGGLKGIPKSLYEAAEVDGASSWQKFFHITLPLLKPIISFTVIMSIIGSYMLFAEIYILTGGGPADSTISIVQLIYRTGFSHFNFGTAAAMTNVLFLIIGATTMLVIKVFGLGEELR